MKFESRCVKIELKEGSLSRAREWANTLNSRREEVLATLRDEGVTLETVFLEQDGDRNFLIYIMRAESFAKVRAVVEKSTHAIDAYHKKAMQEICGPRKELELLVDFSRIDDAKSSIGQLISETVHNSNTCDFRPRGLQLELLKNCPEAIPTLL